MLYVKLKFLFPVGRGLIERVPSSLGSHPPKKSQGSVEADLGMGSSDKANPLLQGFGLVQFGGDAAGQKLLDCLSPKRSAELHVAVLGQQLHELFLLHSPGQTGR